MDISRQLYDISNNERCLIRRLDQGTYMGEMYPTSIMTICRADGKPFDNELIHKIQMIADLVFKYRAVISKEIGDMSWL